MRFIEKQTEEMDFKNHSDTAVGTGNSQSGSHFECRRQSLCHVTSLKSLSMFPLLTV